MFFLKFAFSLIPETLAQLLPELSPLDASAILRIPQVLPLRNRSRSAHYQDIEDGLFPHPVAIGGRAVGHPAVDVIICNRARIAGLPDNEIRALVSKIEEHRKGLLRRSNDEE